MLNSILLNAATKVISNTAACQFILTAKFINASTGSKFSFIPLQIECLDISRNYAENFADEIDLSMTVSPKDWALLQDQGQNLLCILTIQYVDKFGRDVFNPKPIQKQYNVIINNPRDIRKAVPDVHLYTEPSEKMSVRLVEKTVYNLRHVKINTIYQNATVEQAIYGITKAFGIEKIHLVTPDNTHKYDHIDIASYQGIESVYLFLQSKCGIYSQGLNAYITDGVLYVYPPFNTDPKYDKTAIFYQVDTGRFSGSSIYHRSSGKTISIVINTQPHSYDLSIAGSENVGTGFTFVRASRLIDGVTTLDNKSGAQFTDNPALSVNLATNRTIVEGRSNIKHIKATDNPFPQMSEIIAHQASIMQVNWMNADPFQIDPGQSILYYYDKNGVMIKKTGIIEKAYYRISRMERIDHRTMFGCVGQLTLRLSLNETISM